MSLSYTCIVRLQKGNMIGLLLLIHYSSIRVLYWTKHSIYDSWMFSKYNWQQVEHSVFFFLGCIFVTAEDICLLIIKTNLFELKLSELCYYCCVISSFQMRLRAILYVQRIAYHSENLYNQVPSESTGWILYYCILFYLSFMLYHLLNWELNIPRKYITFPLTFFISSQGSYWAK